MTDPEKLSFGNNQMSVEYWPGNDLNPPDIQIEIDAFHTHYDRDYGTEERITGSYDLSLEEAQKLLQFLQAALNKKRNTL
jgi:hypothetical protein